MACRDERDRLGPRECRPLPVRKFGRVPPAVMQMNLSFSNTNSESVSTMVNDTKSTSIDLRSTQLDQFPKFRLESRFFQMSLNVVKALQCRTEQMIHLGLRHSRRNGRYRGHKRERNAGYWKQNA